MQSLACGFATSSIIVSGPGTAAMTDMMSFAEEIALVVDPVPDGRQDRLSNREVDRLIDVHIVERPFGFHCQYALAVQVACFQSRCLEEIKQSVLEPDRWRRLRGGVGPVARVESSRADIAEFQLPSAHGDQGVARLLTKACNRGAYEFKRPQRIRRLQEHYAIEV